MTYILDEVPYLCLLNWTLNKRSYYKSVDSAYGEWIINDATVPKYILTVFDTEGVNSLGQFITEHNLPGDDFIDTFLTYVSDRFNISKREKCFFSIDLFFLKKPREFNLQAFPMNLWEDLTIQEKGLILKRHQERYRYK